MTCFPCPPTVHRGFSPIFNKDAPLPPAKHTVWHLTLSCTCQNGSGRLQEPQRAVAGRTMQGSTAVGMDALLTTLLSGQHLLQKTHTVARWLPYAGHLLCARHCYFLSHTAPGHAATKHQGAQMNGKRDGRNQDWNPSLSDSKPCAFNHQNFHMLIKTFHKG